MPKHSRPLTLAILISTLMSTAANAADPPTNLQPCPSSPNCINSNAQDESHQIAPLKFTIPAEQAWQLLKEQVARLPRTTIVADRDGYLHAECRSALFGFVDDLEFELRGEEGAIAVRSAARTGYYDFGVNRKRVEELRTALDAEGLNPGNRGT